jgi:signal transduction histidine kinase
VISLSRLALAAVAILFGIYHALLGFLVLSEYQNPIFATVGLIVYIAALLLATLDKSGLKMRPVSAAIVLIVSISLPQLIFAALGEVRQGSYATWHIAAIGTLLAIVIIRKFEPLAWVALFITAIEVIQWGGPDVIFNSGLVGALLLVATAQAASWALSSSSASAEAFRKRALAIDTATAASSAARTERTQRLNQTLNEVLPLLEKISDSKGNLTKAEKLKAQLTEAELRDQIRGRNLLSIDVVSETRNARMRGIEVQLLDDGGLDDLSQEDRKPYLWEVASRLKGVKAGKVVVRAARGDSWRVSMAAIRKESDSPDLFIRI